MSNKWALLIGVDFYFQGDKRHVHFDDLKGCVRDVSMIEKYLKKICVQNIEKLTASHDGKNNSNKPAETDETTWPTFNNIKRKLETITQKVKPGDLVHIHYSGHGILRKKLEDSEETAGDAITGTALALTDVMNGGAYLTGFQLGVWVRNLVETKKVRVSITLDSCYSGNGFRNDDGITLRTSKDGAPDESFLDSDEAAAASAAAEAHDLQENDTYTDEDSHSGGRNASVKRSWLSNPEGCTVLTACQLNQRAGEYAFKGKEKNGILTHWMLHLVSAQSGKYRPTYAKLAQHVKSQIKTMDLVSPQTPVLHGDSFYEFFGDQKFIQHATCYVVKVLSTAGSNTKRFHLNVGAAQGVTVGAIYKCIEDPTEIPGPNPTVTMPGEPCAEATTTAPKVRISQTFTFQSEATLIYPDELPDDVIKEGSLLVLDVWWFPSTQLVKLPSLPADENADEFRSVITELENKIMETPRFSTCSMLNSTISPTCNFMVSLNNGALEIRDNQDKRVPRVPAISIDDRYAGAKIAHMMNHLARFKAPKDLHYGKPSHDLSPDNYIFELLDENHNALPPSAGAYEIRDNQDVAIRFINKSEATNVHIAIFIFNATWGIERVYPEDGQPTSHIMSGEGQAQICSLTMCIPDGAQQDDPPDIHDLFRAYVYVGDYTPTWDELLLPDIPADPNLVPIEPLIEPALQEDADDNIITTRNCKAKKERSSVGARKKSQTRELWTKLDLQVHTTPS